MADKVRRNILERQKAREENIAAISADIERFLNRNIPPILKDISRGNLPPVEAAKILLDLETQLRAKGLNKVFDKLAGLYSNELRLLRDQWTTTSKKKLVLSEADIVTVETLVSFETTATANRVRTSVDNIRSAVFREVIAGVAPDINTIVQSESGATANQIATELNTNVAGFQRSITMSKAEELDITHFLYSGGLIETSREFCRERDGNIYTMEEIQRWDNDQGLPADIYLGGYNCRHELLPIDKATAESLGLDTSKF